MEYGELKQKLRMRVQERLGYVRDVTDGEVEEMIDEVLLEEPELAYWQISMRHKLRTELFNALRRLDILQLFVEDPTVTEIMVNGLEHIFIEQNGCIRELDMHFESMEQLQAVIQQIVSGCNRSVNAANPVVDARLENGSRVNVVMNPVAINGPIVTIRRFPDKPMTMERLLELGALSKEAAKELERLVRAGYNIMISGGTGSGKTTFLNALSGFIPGHERVITIEDSAELQLLGLNNLIRLETRNSNEEGCTAISIRDLIRTSLRMRPDRIIVGEVRGGEAFDMMQCLNTGHDGSMSTAHANSATDLLSRLENMVLMGMELPMMAIRRQIASGVDVIVHLSRLRDRSRRVTEIVEVLEETEGVIAINPIFSFRENGRGRDNEVVGELERKGEIQNRKKLEAAGLQ